MRRVFFPLQSLICFLPFLWLGELFRKGFLWLAVAAVAVARAVPAVPGWLQDPGTSPRCGWAGPAGGCARASAARLLPCAAARRQRCFRSRVKTVMVTTGTTNYFRSLHYNLLEKSTWKCLTWIIEFLCIKEREDADTSCSAIGCGTAVYLGNQDLSV